MGRPKKNSGDDGSNTDLDLEDGAGKTGPVPIKFDTERDYSLVADAIERRCDGLDKLASKTADEGYPREARVIGGDAAHLRERILPLVKAGEQVPLPIADARTLVRSELAGFFWRKARWIGESGDKEQESSRIEAVLEYMTDRIVAFGQACSDYGYAAGVAAREGTSESILSRASTSIAPPQETDDLGDG